MQGDYRTWHQKATSEDWDEFFDTTGKVIKSGAKIVRDVVIREAVGDALDGDSGDSSSDSSDDD